MTLFGECTHEKMQEMSGRSAKVAIIREDGESGILRCM